MLLAAFLLTGCDPTLVALNTGKDTPVTDGGPGTDTDTTPGDDDDTDTDTTPGDDDDDGGISAPVLYPIDAFRDDPVVVILGEAEPDSLVTLTATCDMGSSGEDSMTATSIGGIVFDWTMAPGETCDFFAIAEDLSGESDPSNTVSTTLCAFVDPWEGTGLGDDPQYPVDNWAPLPDDGSATVVIAGTLLPGDPGDWFVVRGLDNPLSDAIAGFNEYDLHIQLTGGEDTYSFRVSKGEPGLEEPQCFVEGAGTPDSYTDYNDYVQSLMWGNGTACSAGLIDGYDNCDDMSDTYLIEVVRSLTVPAGCESYEITVTNNAP